MSKDAMVEIMRTFFIFSVLDVILIPDDYIYVVLYVRMYYCFVFCPCTFFYFILSFLKLHYDLYLAILHELTLSFYFIL